MNAVLQFAAPRPTDDPYLRAPDADAAEESLRRALKTLRAIRERYEAGRNAHPDAHCYSVQVAVGRGDMGWISVAIEVLERAEASAAKPGPAYLTDPQVIAQFDLTRPAAAAVDIAAAGVDVAAATVDVAAAAVGVAG